MGAIGYTVSNKGARKLERLLRKVIQPGDLELHLGLAEKGSEVWEKERQDGEKSIRRRTMERRRMGERWTIGRMMQRRTNRCLC